MLSRARWWFLRVFSNSSSFSWILFSISDRIWETSTWARRTLLSSASNAASASSKQELIKHTITHKENLEHVESLPSRPPDDEQSFAIRGQSDLPLCNYMLLKRKSVLSLLRSLLLSMSGVRLPFTWCGGINQAKLTQVDRQDPWFLEQVICSHDEYPPRLRPIHLGRS